MSLNDQYNHVLAKQIRRVYNMIKLHNTISLTELQKMTSLRRDLIIDFLKVLEANDMIKIEEEKISFREQELTEVPAYMTMALRVRGVF